MISVLEARHDDNDDIYSEGDSVWRRKFEKVGNTFASMN